MCGASELSALEADTLCAVLAIGKTNVVITTKASDSAGFNAD
jgi:hypothetical protein